MAVTNEGVIWRDGSISYPIKQLLSLLSRTANPPIEADHVRAGNNQYYIGTQLRSDTVTNSVTRASWESYGPTGSGADNIWNWIDIVPAAATGIMIVMDASVACDGGGSADLQVFTRYSGSSQAANEGTVLLSLGTETTNLAIQAGTNFAIVPLGDDNIFEVYWDAVNDNTSTITMIYRGFVTD